MYLVIEHGGTPYYADQLVDADVVQLVCLKVLHGLELSGMAGLSTTALISITSLLPGTRNFLVTSLKLVTKRCPGVSLVQVPRQYMAV